MNVAAKRELTEPMREPPGTVSGKRLGWEDGGGGDMAESTMKDRRSREES